MPETIILNIDDQTGEMAFIYDDRWAGLLNEGPSTIQRASHVEPGDPARGQDQLKWYADMTPFAGPVLGPFNLRQEALDAEVTWLNQNILTPRSST